MKNQIAYEQIAHDISVSLSSAIPRDVGESDGSYYSRICKNYFICYENLLTTVQSAGKDYIQSHPVSAEDAVQVI